MTSPKKILRRRTKGELINMIKYLISFCLQHNLDPFGTKKKEEAKIELDEVKSDVVVETGK